jgi:hypothetical protein
MLVTRLRVRAVRLEMTVLTAIKALNLAHIHDLVITY